MDSAVEFSIDVEACVVHPTGWEEDCDLCKVEIAALSALHQSMHIQAEKKNKKLAALQGQIDPVSMLNERLDLFIACLLDQNPKQRARFELVWMNKVQAVLDEAVAQITSARLTQGVAHQGLHIPNNGRL